MNKMLIIVEKSVAVPGKLRSIRTFTHEDEALFYLDHDVNKWIEEGKAACGERGMFDVDGDICVGDSLWFTKLEGTELLVTANDGEEMWMAFIY